MGISLAPDAEATDPVEVERKKQQQAATPLPSPGIGLAPLPSAKEPTELASARPMEALPSNGAAPPALAPAAPPTAYGNNATSSIPSPTVAAPGAPVDRVKLATDIFNTTAKSTQGAYDAASKDNIHNSAALGQVGSGGLRTREGNLQLARSRDLDTLREKLVNDATTGSIADATTAFQQALAGSQQGLAAELGRGGLEVQREQTGNQAQQAAAALALQEKLGLGGLSAEQQRIEIAKKQQETEAAYQSGQLTLQQRNAALQELTQAQNNTLQTRAANLAETSNTQNQANETQRIALAKQQLEQTGAQFGLSLAQQRDLAEIADKTANRQLDISSAQGRNALLLELARIMGGPSGNVSPAFLASVAAALGVSTGTTGTTGTATTSNTTSTTGNTGNSQGTGTRTAT